MCILWILSRGLKFERSQIAISRKKMTALLADTPRKMTAGLMFMKSLKQNECMLFVFPRDGAHPIWMRNMKFNIDILWLDGKKKVVDMVESAKPIHGFDISSYSSNHPSRYVVELNAGFVRKNKVKIGDTTHFALT